MSGTKRYFQLALLLLLIAIPIVLWILPSTFFDERALQLCPSIVFFNSECVACGISKAIMHLHHFEFDDALYHNSFSFILYPFLIFVWSVLVLRVLIRLGFLNLSNSRFSLFRRIHKKS